MLLRFGDECLAWMLEQAAIAGEGQQRRLRRRLVGRGVANEVAEVCLVFGNLPGVSTQRRDLICSFWRGLLVVAKSPIVDC